MKQKKSEFILKAGNAPLPDVVLLLLAKRYLEERDCISLIISGASARFSFLFWQNRKGRLRLGQCSFLRPTHFNQLLQKSSFSPLSLTSFDISHCHWIPAKTLCSSVAYMKNLEELNIQDTKLSLSHLLRIFKTCKNILKLSFSLLESNLGAYQKDLDCFSEGFGRLTHLKIFTAVHQSKTAYPIDAWPVTLEVLSWCRDCVDLFIDIAYPLVESSICNQRDHKKKVSNEIRKKFKPLLGWMKSLESLVIISSGIDGGYYPDGEYTDDPFVLELLNWVFLDLELLPRSLKRLWIREDSSFTVQRSLTIEHFITTPFVKALNLWEDDEIHQELNHPKFKQMEHLGGIYFSNSLAHMTQLKFAIGYCVDNYGLSEFCRAHKNLEHLHFDTDTGDDSDDYDGPNDWKDYSIGDGNWTLPNLKSLSYDSNTPQQDAMDHLIKNCPNIEVLYVSGELTPDDGRDDVDFPMGYDVNYLSRIQFHNLTKLTLGGFELLDGNFLIPMVKQCPKLEILHIGGFFTPKLFLSNLGDALKFAKNLRDLRLYWERKEKVSSTLLFLKKLLCCSDHLERLVLHNSLHDEKCVNWASPKIEHVLVDFATVMKRLVALCFLGFRITPNVARKVNRRMLEEVIPLRPSFWFYIDGQFPNVNDTRIPRIHYDEIVNPICGFHTNFHPSTI